MGHDLFVIDIEPNSYVIYVDGSLFQHGSDHNLAPALIDAIKRYEEFTSVTYVNAAQIPSEPPEKLSEAKQQYSV